MKLKILYPFAVFAMLGLVVALTVTSMPSLFGEELSGSTLMAHMMASGGLVFGLPVFAWLGLTRMNRPSMVGGAERLGFWGVVLVGWLTVGTVFLCMLPLLGTDAMHEVMHWHGYAGFAMVPAMGLLLVGWLWSCKQAKRSAKPG